MLDLTLCLDPGGPRPLYQQLYDSLAAQIRDGRLRTGDRLPGKRSLAAQLAVAVNTVDTVPGGPAQERLFCAGVHGRAAPALRRRPAGAGRGE